MKDPQDLEKMIALYLYDELSPAEKREFERHLAADDESRAYVERRKQQHELLCGQPVAEPTDERLLEDGAEVAFGNAHFEFHLG